MDLSIKDYQAAIALAEERHFGRAARRLEVSQPALTSRLYRMEEVLGVRLFTRDRRGVHETPEGSALYEYARRVLEAHEEAKLRVREARHGFGMALRIGTTQLAIHQVLIPSLQAFRHSYPEAQIRLSEGSTFQLERDLEQGELDVVFLHPPLHAPGLNQRVLKTTNIVMADCLGDWKTGDAVIRYPRSEAPVMMGSLERKMEEGQATDLASNAEANTALTSLALSAAGYGAAFITDDMPDFGFDLAEARQPTKLFELQTAVAYRRLDRRPVLMEFLKGIPEFD